VDTEQQMASARAYVTSLRHGEAPELPGSAVAAPLPVDETPFAFAGADGITGGGQWLEFAPGPDGLDLRSAGAVFGRLGFARSGEDRRAETADELCRLAYERSRRSWRIVARAGDDTPIAAYHPGWRAGGDIWVAPDDWFTLRWTPIARGRTWRLTSDGEEILRLQPNGSDHFEMLVERVPARAALLVLLVCQVVMTETVPTGELVLGEGGGVELAVIGP
jgi:hypothetical protein